MTSKLWIICKVGFLSLIVISLSVGVFGFVFAKGRKVIIDSRCSIPDDEREYYSRYASVVPMMRLFLITLIRVLTPNPFSMRTISLVLG